TLGSLLCSLAPSANALIGARVVQALGGSMMNPVALSIIANVFTNPKERARVLGIWGAVFGVSMAAGPLLGGLLIVSVGWRSIFWVNVPIAVIAILLTARFVPESRAPKPRRIDPVGQILVVIILGALTSALIEGPHTGWALPWVGMAALAIAGIVALVIYERQRTEPLLDMRFFKSIPFAGATLLAIVAFSSFNGSLFLSSLYLQTARGLSPAHAGLCLLPIAVTLAICSPLSGKLVGSNHVRFAVVVAGGALSIGAAILLGLDLETPIAQVVIAFVVFGVAMGMINAPITNTAVSGMPRAQAGVASALASTSRQVGATLGIAMSGSIVGVSAHDPTFATGTHTFWAIVLGGGIAVVLLGLFITSKRAVSSANAVATDFPGGVH
ncbi:MAG TPA: MFS transporter, partial [Kofleriaceae bacterium]